MSVRQKTVFCACACLLLAGNLAAHGYDLSVAGLTDRSGRLKAPDFLQFYTYGLLVRSGAANRLYQPSAHAEAARQVDARLAITEFRPNYSPVIAWLVAPLGAMPFLHAMAVFSMLSAALYAAALALLVGVTRWRWRTAGFFLTVAAAWPTLFVVLRYGQVSALSLVLVASAVVATAHRRDLLAGLALGLLIYKPNLLLAPALALLLLRQWRVLLGVALGAGVELLVDLVLVGPAVMQGYFGVLLEIARRPGLVQFFPAESHSLQGFVRLLLPWPWLVTATAVIAIPLTTCVAVRVWRTHEDWRPRWAALITAAMLASPHLLTYDLLLLAAPLILIVDWRIETTGTVAPEQWRWALLLLYFGAWPGTFIARLYHVQVSTLGMLLVLWLLAQPPRAVRA